MSSKSLKTNVVTWIHPSNLLEAFAPALIIITPTRTLKPQNAVRKLPSPTEWISQHTTRLRLTWLKYGSCYYCAIDWACRDFPFVQNTGLVGLMVVLK
jgi:hypothetical protein